MRLRLRLRRGVRLLMPVSVEQVSSEVTVEPAAGQAAAASPEQPWQRLALHEGDRDRLAENERRVCARGFDD